MTLTQRILERDNYRCQYCGKRATEADHLFSKAEGRRHDISRDDELWIVAACHDCNGLRGTRRFVPLSCASLIEGLEQLTGKVWREWNGDPKSKAFTELLI